MFVQRAGRAARSPGTTGLAVLLVEPSAYSLDRDFVSSKSSNSNADKKKPKRPKGVAASHGRYRGATTTLQANNIDRTHQGGGEG